MSRILVVDDEPQIVRALAINLRARGYDVCTAGDGTEALHLAAAHPPDVVILDLGLPDLDGVDVIAGLRGWTSVPILVLSGRSDSIDKVDALDAGADDYVVKPFGMDELMARLRAAVRRATPDRTQPAVVTEHFTVDLAAKRVTSATGEVKLTATEWHLLEVLVRHHGRTVQHRQLLEEVWGSSYLQQTNYLRVYIAALRRKLEPDPARPRYILTASGLGYRFETEPSGTGNGA
ncbi:MAG TPA: response regulator transcription factor [Propionibacteriaceae bacterium]|nr:response regulator transcription factor [Propionibacteriaceae bacterium]